MRYCVPLLVGDPAHPDDLRLASHFGLASRFALIDGEQAKIVGDCASNGVCRGPCACPMPDLAAHEVDALIGPALGFRLLQLSRRAGLPVFATRAQTLGELLRELANGALRPLATAVCLTAARRCAIGDI